MNKAFDHKGNEFDSVQDMCEYWHVHYTTFNSRIKTGLSLKEALENKVRKNYKECQDHEGNIFKSEKEMAIFWGISYMLYKSRKKQGWNIKDRLLGKPEKIKYITDHEGNKFKSKKEMCKFWNVNETTYNSRIKYGWTLKEALEGKTPYIYDHKGNKFKNIEEMAEYWNIDLSKYHDKKEYSPEENLGLVPHLSIENTEILNTYLTDTLFLKDYIVKDDQLFCVCEFEGTPVILHNIIVKKICRKYNENRILKKGEK